MKKNGIAWKKWMVLFGAAFMFILSGGDRPLELAVWCAPLLLLRYFQVMKPGRAFLIAYPVIALSVGWASRAMTPLPLPFYIVSMAVSGVIMLLPYWLHRILTPHLPMRLRTLLFPVMMVALDYITSRSGWGTWGHSAYAVTNLSLLQLASVTGIWGVGFLIYWTAAIGNSIWAAEGKRINHPLVIVWSAVLVTVLLFGFIRIRINTQQRPMAVAGVMLAAEQQKAFESALLPLVSMTTVSQEAVEQIRALSLILADSLLARTAQVAADSVRMILWNEAAVPIFQKDTEWFMTRICELAREYHVILGAAFAVVNDDLYGGMANAIDNRLMLISAEGEVVWKYSKSILVPGPETLMSQPGDSLLRAGSLADGKISGAICYEMDFPSYIQQAAKLRSELFLTPANDWQAIKRTHAKMALLRAIENGTALFRVVSRGVSQAVNPVGHVQAEWDYFIESGVFKANISIGHIRTLYSVIGDGFAVFCVLFACLLLGTGFIGIWRARHP